MSADPGDDAPLAGLTILEVSSFVAAPLGGLTLAQLGADVIRIDPIGGSADIGRGPLAPSGTSQIRIDQTGSADQKGKHGWPDHN